MLNNVVSNAIKFTQAGEIKVSCRMLEKNTDTVKLEFVVSDTGIGVATQHIPRLTERFYRVDRGRSRETGGTGLGLAIVKHVLSRHGATLVIESELGRGSRFSARFPKKSLAGLL